MAATPRLLYSGLIITITLLAGSMAQGQTNACTTAPCVTTYHNDPMRDGVNSQETALKPTLFPSQSAANFGLLTPAAGGATGAVDGLIYAQPLYLSAVKMATTSACPGVRNIVLVATENNSVYAFAWTYTLSTSGYTFSLTQCWMLNLNQPGEFAIPFTVLPVVANLNAPCNTIVPQIGITGTPVIDTFATSPVMYVVSAHQTASLTYTYRLHAITINTGNEVLNGSSAPYDLSGVFPSGISPIDEMQRPGLAMFNASSGTANIYVTFGSYCDVLPYSGYLAGLTYNYSTSSFAPVAANNWVFDTQGGETEQAGGLWMAGAAPAVDSAGNVYVTVGNGNWNGTTFFGESVVKIATTSSGLVPVDYYTPNDFAQLNANTAAVTVCSTYASNSCPSQNQLTLPKFSEDFDLGSGGVTLISPAGIAAPVCGSNSELVTGGKEGVVYGVCYSTQTGSTPQDIMGGLDGCGYLCMTISDPTITGCSESSVPGNGFIAQCFQGANAGEHQANGSNTIFGSSGIRGPETFWAGSSSAPENYLYVAGANAPLVAYQVDSNSGLLNPVGNTAQVPKTYPIGTVPSLSWDGTHANTALLWTMNSAGSGVWKPNTNSSVAASPAALIVYDAVPNIATHALKEVWESSQTKGNNGPGAVKFTVPTVAGGLVFVPGGAPGYAPGPPAGKGVNCTASALVASGTPPACGGLLSVYGKLHR